MQSENNADVQGTLLVAGGIALIALGAGMLLTNPALRGALAAGLRPLLPEMKDPMGNGLSALLPDLERYMRIKAM
jgi:hypothetical protein